ncbi:nebulin-like isoform X1 [Canis lupus familiaris]|uniref:nebulin-like isoform X1 n=1 Tax=Canis lupus familiaris TaxID=9615 RepID=UPI0018F361E6|nr:nebulin-like isoform X1 [Canis lupus familiaris]
MLSRYQLQTARTHYMYLPDAMVSSKHTRNVNQIQSDKLYQDAWNKDKTNITIPSDMPGMLQAPINALQISNKFYQKDWNETKQKGYDFKADAIEIKQAKDSRDISSEIRPGTFEGYRMVARGFCGSDESEECPFKNLLNERLYKAGGLQIHQHC